MVPVHVSRIRSAPWAWLVHCGEAFWTRPQRKKETSSHLSCSYPGRVRPHEGFLGLDCGRVRGSSWVGRSCVALLQRSDRERRGGGAIESRGHEGAGNYACEEEEEEE